MATRTPLFLLLLIAACTGREPPIGTDAGVFVPDAARADTGLADTGIPGVDAGPVDPATLCPEGRCNLISNEGCGSSSCRYLSLDGVSDPVPICESDGRGTEGAPCLDYSGCGTGMYCSPFTFVCVSYCCGGSDATCGPGTFCLDLWGGAGFCEPDRRCNLFTSSDCAEGERCLILGDDGATVCLDGAGAREEGEPCSATECGVGMQCARGEDEEESTCKRFCTVGEQAGCDVGKRCESEELSRRPDVGMCNDVEDPCSGSPNSGACTNAADCGIYEANTLATVTAAIGCAEDVDPASCVARETGLSAACAGCFGDLPTSDRGDFLSCAGF